MDSSRCSEGDCKRLIQLVKQVKPSQYVKVSIVTNATTFEDVDQTFLPPSIGNNFSRFLFS